jgi:molybdopterin-dependent oxidoreductase alpha subunit
MQAMAADMQPGIDANFWSRFSISQMSRWTPRQLETSGRLIQPIIYRRGQSHYQTITWKEALDKIAAKLKSLSADQTFWYFSGRSSNEAGFLLQVLARVYGTNNVNNCSYFCHQASGVGLSSTLGTGTATLQLEDVEKCDLLFVIGGNPASNHPRLMTTMMHLRRRGGKIVVINPMRELGLVKFKVPSDPISMLFGTKIASHYIQPHIGGDLALLTGIAKAVVESDHHDPQFLQLYCNDADTYLRQLHNTPWSEIESKSGVSETDIRQIADVYAQSNGTVFSWTMGITHHEHGVENVEAIVNLALLRGMVGRNGAGLMPIRGHSNIQGIGSVGVTPKLKDEIFKNLTEKFQLKLPTTPGMDTLACLEAADERKLKFGLCLGGNLYGSAPDAEYANQALSRLELLVMLSTTLNTGHANGLAEETIVLPVLARDEEPEPTTQESMFNYVRISEGGPRRHPGPRSEVQVIADLGQRLFGDNTSGIDWQSMHQTQTIRHWIAETVPGYQQVALADATRKEFQIVGRTFHQPTFATANGKANLKTHDIPQLHGSGNELRLMTIRSEGQFNTVVYEDYDLYRNQERRDIILIHPDDLERLAIPAESLVTVRSNVGQMNDVIARAYPEIRPGNVAMYYPESNVLVPRRVDGRSKTPAFKCVLVRVELPLVELKKHAEESIPELQPMTQVG